MTRIGLLSRRAMNPECIVVDFDGTFTDVEQEAKPFLARYRDGLAAHLGELDARWDAASKRVLEHPNEHGFRFEGRIVAPSHADPFILATSIAHVVLAEEGGPTAAHHALLEALFKEAYATCGTVFRDDAQSTLDALLDHGAPVYVVTNSHTEHVHKKLSLLRGAERLKVLGNARKFHLVAPDPIDERFLAVPEQMELEGLDRPLYLRRGRYYELLRTIWAESGATPRSTLIGGDIFELDLALPAMIGARVHLVARAGTPRYELAAVAKYGSHSSTLAGLLHALS